MCLTLSSESKIDISFKEQFCSFFVNVITLYMHMLLVCLLITQKKSPGKVSYILPLEGDSLPVKQIGQEKKIE